MMSLDVSRESLGFLEVHVGHWGKVGSFEEVAELTILQVRSLRLSASRQYVN